MHIFSKFLIFLSGSLGIFTFTNLPAQTPQSDERVAVHSEWYAFPTGNPSITADWTEDFDTAVLKALNENKLVFLIAKPVDKLNPYILGNTLSSGKRTFWTHPKFKDYLKQNFVCVYIPMFKNSNMSASRNKKFAVRHDEILKEIGQNTTVYQGLKPTAAFVCDFLMNPEKEKGGIAKITNIYDGYESPIPFINLLESKKESILDNYKAQKQTDPREKVSSSASRSIAKETYKFKKIVGWEDDVENAKRVAKRNKGIILLVIGAYDIEQVIETSGFFNSKIFKSYAKENFALLKIGQSTPSVERKYPNKKALDEFLPTINKSKNYNCEFLAKAFTGSTINGVRSYKLVMSSTLLQIALYDIENNKSLSLSMPETLILNEANAKDILAEIGLAKLKLESMRTEKNNASN